MNENCIVKIKPLTFKMVISNTIKRTSSRLKYDAGRQVNYHWSEMLLLGERQVSGLSL